MLRPAVALVALSLLACGSRPPPETTVADTETDDTTGAEPDPTPPPPAAPEARVRLIHAAIEGRDQAVSLASDGATGDAAGFEFASTYLTLTPGEHAISARAGDSELISATFTLAEGSSTIIAYSAGAFPVALVHAPDVSEPAPENSARIRVFHAVVGLGAVDLCVPAVEARADGTPVVLNIAAGAMATADGSYTEIQTMRGAELALQLRAHHATPCHGRALGTAHGFTPIAESNYTLVLVGRSGRRAAAPELLFCADPPAIDTSCATVTFDAH